jgi:hypothetical protein
MDSVHAGVPSHQLVMVFLALAMIAHHRRVFPELRIVGD